MHTHNFKHNFNELFYFAVANKHYTNYFEK